MAALTWIWFEKIPNTRVSSPLTLTFDRFGERRTFALTAVVVYLQVAKLISPPVGATTLAFGGSMMTTSIVAPQWSIQSIVNLTFASAMVGRCVFSDPSW
ncbi:hypothetical protein BDM02DRAFT_3116120 [Thelephora ganbajun]|uniref:Uncharacterized protein n=1 Tax=Thelephora ganbajun TaxID=370292 RepID=A0ACB6ZEM8_THEGA|nr:hypothetical protein BDM02DRAFT_3116120 [Thelephora ganbajun]